MNGTGKVRADVNFFAPTNLYNLMKNGTFPAAFAEKRSI